jgi:hypothetical protein
MIREMRVMCSVAWRGGEGLVLARGGEKGERGGGSTGRRGSKRERGGVSTGKRGGKRGEGRG